MPKLQQTLKAVILCLAALICVALNAQERRRVAVLEPYGNVAVTVMNKANVRGALTEIIVNTGRYTAVDRSRTDKILQEHRFQRSALSDSSKARQLGKLLGADLICVTEILKDRGEFNIECSIIDVETGEIVNSASEFLENDTNAVIRRAVQEMVSRMLKPGDTGSGGAKTAHTATQAAEDVIRLWEVTRRLDSSDTFIQGDDVYTLAKRDRPNYSFDIIIYKNRNEIRRFDGSGSNPYSICVSGNDDYVAGSVGLGKTSRATIWKNGKSQTLSNRHSEARYVYVNGSDVFVSGWEEINDERVPVLWLNGFVIRRAE